MSFCNVAIIGAPDLSKIISRLANTGNFDCITAKEMQTLEYIYNLKSQCIGLISTNKDLWLPKRFDFTKEEFFDNLQAHKQYIDEYITATLERMLYNNDTVERIEERKNLLMQSMVLIVKCHF